MTDLNHFSLIGRLVSDIKVSYIGQGTAKGELNLAVNRSRKDGDKWVDEVSFLPVVLWGKAAENMKTFLTKGKQVAVWGHVHQDRWEKDGKKQSKILFVSDSIQLIGGKSEGSGSGNFTPTNDNGFTEDVPF